MACTAGPFLTSSSTRSRYLLVGLDTYHTMVIYDRENGLPRPRPGL